MQGAIAEEAKATCVGGDIATDLTTSLGTEVDGHDVVVGSDIICQGLEDTSSICDEDTCGKKMNIGDRDGQGGGD